MTAYSDKGYFERFSEIGFSTYLLKPVDFRNCSLTLKNVSQKCRPDDNNSGGTYLNH